MVIKASNPYVKAAIKRGFKLNRYGAMEKLFEEAMDKASKIETMIPYLKQSDYREIEDMWEYFSKLGQHTYGIRNSEINDKIGILVTDLNLAAARTREGNVEEGKDLLQGVAYDLKGMRALMEEFFKTQ